jgi:predicted dehydrogenase
MWNSRQHTTPEPGAGQNPVRWGIIGCGDVTEVKSGPGFQLAQGSELVAVMRRQAALAEDYARRHGVARWYDRAADLIADPSVDAVYVATPVGNHLEYALAACAAGKPCYVEKPMARNHRECREMIAEFTRMRLPLFVAYYRRALPRFLKAKELVETGVLGTLLEIRYRYASQASSSLDPAHLPWRLLAEQAGGGRFLDLGSHTLDILDFILGPLRFVQGCAERRGTGYQVEDRVVIEFTLRDGTARGSAEWDFCAPGPEDRIEISGDAGCLRLSTFGNEPVEFRPLHGDAHRFDLPNPRHIQQPLIQTVVNELLGTGRCESTGLSAARTSLLMDQALQNYYGGREDAFWLRPESWPGLRTPSGTESLSLPDPTSA